MNGLALCAGAGGIELGLHMALPDYRCCVFVEREAYAAAVLVARMEDKALDTAPIWSDLLTFDGRPWRGVVDLISTGFPCQPWSVAGSRKGVDDDRWIWPDIARIVREVGPEWVVLENVPDLANGGLHLVLGDLAEMGFDAEWDLLSASEVGATQLRERIFILAHSRRAGAVSIQPIPIDGGAVACADRIRCDGLTNHTCGNVHQRSTAGRDQGSDGIANRSSQLGSTDRNGQPELRESGARECNADRSNDAATVAPRFPRINGARLVDRGLPAFPPGQDDFERWIDVIESFEGVEPVVRGVAHGVASRLDRLHSTGNGAVPVAVAVAFLRLRNRLTGVAS